MQLVSLLKQHPIAIGFFVLYALGWVTMYCLPGVPSPEQMVYPAITSLLVSFVYCFTLLLLTVFFDEHRKLFLGGLLLSIALPLLLLQLR